MGRSLATAAVAAMALAGCNTKPAVTAPGAKTSGRYSGVGVFEAGRLWGQMSGIAVPKDKAAATIADDEHVIVVLDSHTGEVRQCGDHSGYCVAMKPWGAAGSAPVGLTLHAADLDSQDTQTEEAIPADRTKKR